MPTRAEKFPPEHAADLEAALADLEAREALSPAAPEQAAAEEAPAAQLATAEAAARTSPAPGPQAEQPAAPTAEPGTSARPRTAPRRAQPPTPPSLRIGRARLLPELKEALLARQLQWIAWSACAGAVLSATGLAASWPLLSLALGLGLGALAAFPRRWARGLVVTLGAVCSAAVAHLVVAADARTVVHGAEVLAAGAVVGLGLAWLDGLPADRWRRLHGVLGGAAAAGLGWWAAESLVGHLGVGGPVQGALQGAMLGLVASQALVAAALAWVETDRLPKPGRIHASLAPAYREPVLRARELDQGFDHLAPDPESRDGLGEVAAWVYRLQWTLQALDQELDALDDLTLVERRVELTARAAEVGDEFTRERLEATARHLAQLGEHRRNLARERTRSAALSEYASAYLEEARASLALARLQPGDHAPPRLDDVLGRLRAHAAEQDALRRTAREVGSLA